MEAAAIMAIALANGSGRPPDWQDFVGIIALLVINSTISFIEENNAGNAAAALMAGLAPKTKVLFYILLFTNSSSYTSSLINVAPCSSDSIYLLFIIRNITC